MNLGIVVNTARWEVGCSRPIVRDDSANRHAKFAYGVVARGNYSNVGRFGETWRRAALRHETGCATKHRPRRSTTYRSDPLEGGERNWKTTYSVICPCCCRCRAPRS